MNHTGVLYSLFVQNMFEISAYFLRASFVGKAISVPEPASPSWFSRSRLRVSAQFPVL